MSFTNRAAARVVICLTVLVVASCARDSSVSKADSAVMNDTTAVSDSAEAAHAAGTLEGPTIDIDSARGPIGSTEGTIGETRTTKTIDRPRDSVISGPYKTIDSLGHIKK